MGLVDLVAGIPVDSFWYSLCSILADWPHALLMESLTNPQYSIATCSVLLSAVLAVMVVGIFLPSNPSRVTPAIFKKVGARSV